MTTRRLLLSGKLGRAVANELAAHLPEMSVRAREEPTSEDIAWADSYSGFAWPRTSGPVSFNWVHCMGAGVDAFAGHAEHIRTLSRTVGGMPERMGSFVLALVLNRVHNLQGYAEAQRDRNWQPREPLPLPKRAAVLGTGAIASGIAQVLGRNGLTVTGVNRSGAPADGFVEVYSWRDIHCALDSCDLLVAALPGSRSTEAIVDHAVLGRLRSAQFINVGRGRTLDLDGLQKALAEDAVSHADLDVFSSEPLDAGSWLWTHPAVRITPHVAALTTVDDVVDAIVDTYKAMTHGLRPGLSVDQRRLA